MNGTIFDIKEFSIHDGPGARITVFMKGCPLRCKWCHNPEGLSGKPQLMIKENICTHCMRCRVRCGHDECKPFGRCIHACANGCISVTGKTISDYELADKIKSNGELLNFMGGGVTFSGGEPLMQADFVCAVAQRLGDMHKAIQTSGYADFETYKKVIEKMDFVMQDIKLADDAAHIKYTGVSNDRIINNIKWLKNSGKNFVLRVPLIPDITDTEENLKKISQIAENARVELLRYNPLAGAKYEMLGMTYSLEKSKNRDEDFTSCFENAKME